jgi:hypothetical protein
VTAQYLAVEGTVEVPTGERRVPPNKQPDTHAMPER